MLIKTKELREAIINASFSTSKDKESSLYNILIETNNNKIEVKSQNNITKFNQTLNSDQEENIKVLIDPQKIINILKEMKDETIQINKEDNILKISSGNFKTKLKTLNPEVFPEIKENPDKNKICNIKAEKLKKLIKETIYCPDKNDIAREYTGIYLEIKDKTVKATATDHYRLINISTDNESEIETELIIENNGANLINKIPIEGTIDVYLGEKEIYIKCENISISSKIIKGNFPDYNQILLDKETSNIIELDREELKETIKRSSVLSENREISVNININEKEILISSQNQEGEIAEDKIGFNPIKANDNLIIKLDSKFILDFINQITPKTVILLYRTSEEPIMFEAKEDDFLYKYIMTPIVE